MARLRINHKLIASTLVEALIAMVILLTVFSIALYIFANLYRSNSKLEDMQVQKRLVEIRQLYLDGEVHYADLILLDSIKYHIIVDNLAKYDDMIKLKIYAQDLHDLSILDSLISVHEKKAHIELE